MFKSARSVFWTAHVVLWLAVVCTGLLASCYPGDQLTVSEADVVVTLFDDQANFATKLTYAMPDTIVHIVKSGGEDDISRALDDEMLARVASNMSAQGFTRVTDPATADVFMLVSVTAQNEMGFVGYPWGGYWGWYYPYPPDFGWGWYPWYGGGTMYTYRTGTVFMQMIDPAGADSTEAKVPTIWVGALNGMVQGTTKEIQKRVDAGIDQAFLQSPYLGDGK